MGGRGGTGGSKGSSAGGGTATQIRDTYHNLLPTHGVVGWVPLSDMREALPNLSREQFDLAIKTLVRTNPRAKIVTWDNQKVLTPAQRAAAIRFGGKDAHVFRIDRRLG